MLFHRKLGYYSSNLDDYIDQVKKGDYSYLSMIFCVFAEDSDKHKLRAAQVLNEVLNKISLDDVYRIDLQMRETTSMEWSINWSTLNIKYFITNQMSPDEKCAVLIFASFNPNGYIREQAVKNLVAYKETLIFILLRCNDWVYQVRHSALLLLQDSIVNASDEEIVNALPLVEKLHRSERCEYNSIRSIIFSVFESNNLLIKKGLRSSDVRARRFCISFLSTSPIIEAEYLVKHIQSEKDPFLRKLIYKNLLKISSNIMDVAIQFLKDKYPPNRLLALQSLYDNKTDFAINVSERMLMDRNAKVRALARFIVLQSKREFDIHQYYIDNLTMNTTISLYGLGEVGSQKDCNLLENYLSNNSNSIVRAAMTALMRLDPETYAFNVTEMLLSEHSSIVKTAVLLLKKYEVYEFERVYQIQECSLSENTKIKCASLLFLSSKWNKLIYILLLIGSDYEKLEKLCHNELERWIFSFNKSFAVPSESDKQKVKELLLKKTEFLKPNIIKEIMFLIR